MDIVLERILSLIPKKTDGKFAHGALKEFANSIGLKSGNLVSDWISGRSQSYKNYLYEISAKYNVSVEWLKGETDIKEKLPANSREPQLNMSSDEWKAILGQMSKDQRKEIMDIIWELSNQD